MESWQILIVSTIVVVAVIIVIYKSYRVPSEKKDARLRGLGTTPASYAQDEAYSPGKRGGSSPPFPIGKRTKREPTDTARTIRDSRDTEGQ